MLGALGHVLKATRVKGVLRAVLERYRSFGEDELGRLAESVRDCADKALVEREDCPDLLRVAEFVLDCDSEVTCESWSGLVALITPSLPDSDVLSLAVPLVLKLCNFSRPVFVRKTGVGLLSVLSSAIPQSFPVEVLEKLNLLTQDTSYEVRKCVCAVLPKVLADLGTAEQHFLWVETLLLDEEMPVKRAAIRMFAAVIQLLSADFVAERAVPLLVNEVLPTPDPESQSHLIQGTGQFLSVLCGSPQHEAVVSSLLHKYLQGLTHSEALKLKGLQAFFEVCQAVKPAVFDEVLRPIYVELSEDSSAQVRQAASSLFPQLIHYLESFPEDLRRLSEAFLGDKDCKWTVIGQIQDWPQSLITSKVMEMLKDALVGTKQWRLQLKAVESLHKVLTPSLTPLVYDMLLASLLTLLHTSVSALRQALTSFLQQLLHHTFQTSHRQLLLTRLLEDFAQSKTWTDRLVYVDLCLGAGKLVSREFFRRYFVRNLLGMAVDPVISVRTRLAMELDTVKWLVSGDEASEALLHEALVRLCEDRCALVSQVASDSQSRMVHSAFIHRLESGERDKDEEGKLAYERSMDEYERTLEEQRRRRIIEDLAAKTRAAHIKDKQHSYKRNSLKIPKPAVSTKSRLSFSEDHTDYLQASSPKAVKSAQRRK